MPGLATNDNSHYHYYSTKQLALSPRSRRFMTPSTSSAITCSNGTHTVDCSGSGDLVISAVLTIPHLKPGKKYDVWADLNQTIPQLIVGNGNPMQWTQQETEVIDSGPVDHARLRAWSGDT